MRISKAELVAWRDYLLNTEELINKHKIATIRKDLHGEWAFRQFAVKIHCNLKSYTILRSGLNLYDCFTAVSCILRSCALDSIEMNYLLNDGQKNGAKNPYYTEADLDVNARKMFCHQIGKLAIDYKDGHAHNADPEQKKIADDILNYINGTFKEFLTGTPKRLDEVESCLIVKPEKFGAYYKTKNGEFPEAAMQLFHSYSILSKVDHSGPATADFMSKAVSNPKGVIRTLNDAAYNICGAQRGIITGLSMKLKFDVTAFHQAHDKLMLQLS